MRTRLILPLTVRLKTMIGNLLSMHSEIAVESMTFRPCCSTSRYVNRGSITAFLSSRGSALYTPSTLVAFKITSAPISTARSEAVVSVVKKGLPLPPAKITTRPFSRWRIARRRI